MVIFDDVEKEISYYKKVIHPLATLVETVNKYPSSSFAITINVKGTVITGILVSLKEYHERLSNQLIEGSEGLTDQESMRGMKDIVTEMKAKYGHPTFNELANSYVCIRDPTFILGNITNSFQLKGQYWIGKLKSVDGFVPSNTVLPSPGFQSNSY